MIGIFGRVVDRVAAMIGVDAEKLRYLIVGGANTVFGVGIYPALMFSSAYFHDNYIATLAVSQAVSIVFAFTTYKLLVFRSRGNIAAEFMKFVSFNAAGFAANWAIVPAVVELRIAGPVVAQMTFAAVWVVGAYVWHRAITFSKGPSHGGA